MKQDIDYFKGMSTEDLHKRFMERLYSKTEFIQYNDPDDFFDPEQEYGDHITRCIAEEKDFIRELVHSSAAQAGAALTDDQIEALVQQKREEINLLAGSAIEDYIEKVSVTYIDPLPECSRRFPFQKWLCRLQNLIQSLFTRK